MQFASPIDGMSDMLNDDERAPQNPGTLLDLICVEVANLLAATDRPVGEDLGHYDYGGKLSLGAFDLLTQAQAIDANLASWPGFVPTDWVPVQVPASKVPKTVVCAGFYGQTCDVYPDIMVCSTWNEWRVARLMVLGLIARIDHKASKSQAVITIQELVDGICASVPFSLGDRIEYGGLYEPKVQYPSLPGRPMSEAHQKTAGAYGGWYMFAPFKETLKVGMYLRKGQRDWLYGQLMRLARMYDVTPE